MVENEREELEREELGHLAASRGPNCASLLPGRVALRRVELVRAGHVFTTSGWHLGTSSVELSGRSIAPSAR